MDQYVVNSTDDNFNTLFLNENIWMPDRRQAIVYTDDKPFTEANAPQCHNDLTCGNMLIYLSVPF